ncbi:acyltransferase family protein [Herminiimonas contaminans]|uniref:Acyltransferase n=1 Tax=Herminiimonas contaminans TaxID=1111140 RepID=A0ABS0EUB4_9BURK|nr:acyltransferase [Herminiimonas contaminans]MBF8178425.1 acyltransferase [Herminiimonas contaminans]
MSGPRLEVLDGWRGVSILCVLAAHLLPMGPKVLQMNAMFGLLGMSLFFTLSGFLITSFLLKDPPVSDFLVRRFFRILPLAWLYLALALTLAGASADTWLSHFFFYANLPPVHLVTLTEHIWSLCLEMQFYLGIALLFALFGVRSLLLLPLSALFFTGLRITDGVYASSISYYRMDEILAGCTLALLVHHRSDLRVLAWLKKIPQWPLLLLLLVSCHEQGAALNYLRPYLAALLVGSTIVNPAGMLAAMLNRRVLVYLATISYALYVIHPLLAHTWLGSGDVIVKYLKRPLLFAVLFVLAHISTFYFEHWWIARGKLMANKLKTA